MSDPVTKALGVLNDALERDPEAITQLVNLRVPCRKTLGDHPTVQIALYGDEYRVGILGLLNGMLGDPFPGKGAVLDLGEHFFHAFLRVRIHYPGTTGKIAVLGGLTDELVHFFKTYWTYRGLPNVHLYHYSDMKRNLRGAIGLTEA